MADKKISALTASTTPLAGTEVLPIVQGGSTVKVSVANLTAGRAIAATDIVASGEITSTTNNARISLYRSAGTNYFDWASGQTLAFGTQTSSGGAGRVSKVDFLDSGDLTNVTGNFVVGTAGKGIDFSANTHAAGMTSELLGWYEEGAWTPTLSFGGASVGITYGTQTGKYTRIGNRVFFNLIIILTSQGSSTGGASISGLPFAAAEGVACSTLINNMSAVGTVPQSFANASAVDLYYQTTGANAQYTHGNFTNTAQLYISGCYRV